MKKVMLVLVCLFASVSSGQEQIVVQRDIVERGVTGSLEEVADGEPVVRRGKPLIAADVVYYPIFTGIKGTASESGWSRPERVLSPKLAGIASLDLVTGESNYCRIPTTLRARYAPDELRFLGPESLCFRVLSNGLPVFSSWHRKTGRISILEGCPSETSIPENIREYQLQWEFESYSATIVKVVYLRKSASGFVANWYDEGAYFIGEFKEGSWNWIFDFDKLRRACNAEAGTRVIKIVPLTNPGNPKTYALIYFENTSARVVSLEAGVCQCVYEVVDFYPTVGRLSSDGELIAFEDLDNSVLLIDLKRSKEQRFRKTNSRTLIGLMGESLVFLESVGDVVVKSTSSDSEKRFAAPSIFAPN